MTVDNRTSQARSGRRSRSARVPPKGGSALKGPAGLAVRAARERPRSSDAGGGHAAARTVAYAGVGENARVPAYMVNEDAVRHAQRLIDARRYVLRSRWQDVQPRAREQNAFLKTHSWEEYAAWHLGLTEGANEETKGALRVRLWRLPPSAPDGADRLPLPCGGVAAQGDRTGSTRAPAVPRTERAPHDVAAPRAAAPLGDASGFVPKPARGAQRRPTSTVDAGGRCVDVRRFERRPPRQRN